MDRSSMAAKPRARQPRSDEVGRNSGNESSDVDDDEEESGKSGETAIPAEPKEERLPPSPEDSGVQRSGEASPACGGVALTTKTTKKPPPASQEEDDASPARGGPLPDDSADAGHSDKRAATPKRGKKRSSPPLQEDERQEKRAAGTDADTVAAESPKRKKKKSKRSGEKDRRKKKKLGGNGGNEGSDDDAEESGKSGEDAIPSPLKRAEQRSPPSPEDAGPLPDDSADAGHDNKRAATPKRGEKRSPPLLQEEERPEKRAAAGPDADTVAASAPKRKKNRRKKKKKKALAKPTSPLPPEDEHHGREMAEQEPSNTSPPHDEHRAREEEQQEKKKIAEPSNTSPSHNKGVHSAHGEEEVANQEHADNTSLAPPSPRLNLQSDPEPMGFWGVEVKPGEPYTINSVQGCLRITQATLGNLESVGWNTIACSVGGKKPVGFCALNSTLVMYRLDLECGEGQNVVFSVIGDSSIHLAGYYKISDAAANVQALVTQIQEADDRDQITHVHGAQEHNDLADTEVHNDGINLMVGQAGLNASPNVQALVTQSQEAADLEITHAHDIAQGCNALETEVHIDCTNQIAGQSGLNNMIFDAASLGSGYHRVDKNDVGGTINELKIVELKLGDCNAEIASDGKEVEVEYIGKLMDGTVFDSFEGRPTTHTFTLGVDKMIAGWHQGIKGMRVGGRRILTIPPALAYKDKAQKQIPANSWLVYDIELLRVSEPVK